MWYVVSSSSSSCYLPFVTLAVHDGVHPPVEQAVFGVEAGYPVGTCGVVTSATLVRRAEHTDVRVLGRLMSLAAPLGAGH